jgi:hypothetical protein
MNAPIDSPLAQAKRRLSVLDIGGILFPGWRLGKSCRSPFREDRRPSFSVFEDGRKWKDFGTGAQGDAVDFLALARNMSRSDAAKALIALAGTGAGAPPITRRIETKPVRKPPSAPMPPHTAKIWGDGVDLLRGSPQAQQSIEKWRHWPAGTVRKLAEDGLMGCSELRGQRGIAFPVQAPFQDEFGLVSTFDVGIHFRHKSGGVGSRIQWSYLPTANAPCTGCPALPFVIGAGFLPFARAIIITEGQWDAITLAAAAGWLVSDAAWPERITVFATRGATAWRPLIDLWSSYWGQDAKFFLFADGDAAGAGWKAPGGFTDALCKLGHHVSFFRPRNGCPKDLNDIHRIEPITPEIVAQLISESWLR